MKRVLYVGTELCENLRQAATSKNTEVSFTIAPNGNKALEELPQRFDLIIIQVGLPDISGWEILQQAKEKENTRIIFIGNIPLSTERMKILREEGLHEYILGPMHPEKLFEKIISYFQN